MKFLVGFLCLFFAFKLCRFELNISPVLEMYRGLQKSINSDSTDSNTQSSDYFWAQLAMASLRQILEYDYEHRDVQMLDGVVGLRMAEGQLVVLLRRVPSIPVHLRNEIVELVMLANKVSNLSIPAVAMANLYYYTELGIVLDEHFWEHDYPIRKTKFDLVDGVNSSQETLNEAISDQCISELLGTGKYRGHPCSISDKCWGTMTAPNYKLYSLTHEIIYLLIGETMGCANVMGNSAKRYCHMNNQCHTLSELHQIFCANVIHEMKQLEEAGFPGNKQDLFLEQVAVCGILGFKDVCTVHWLKLMISWQKESGCYVRTDIPENPQETKGKLDKRMDKTLSV